MRLWVDNFLILRGDHSVQRLRGKARLHFRYLTLIECIVQGTLVPAGEDIEAFSVDEDVAWVLIVEKEVIVHLISFCVMKSLRKILGSFSDVMSAEGMQERVHVRNRDSHHSQYPW
jgi:hypothetical protein